MKCTLRLLATTIAAVFLLALPSCQETPVTPAPQESITNHHTSLQKITVSEDFEAGTKTSYAAADVTFGSGIWNLNDALVGTSTSDPKNGTKSIRTRISGKLTMKFNRTDGAGVVTVKHAKYGTDANSTWQLWYSTNSGSTWTQIGSTITTSSTTLATASFTVNITGTIRFEIRKTDGTSARVNFDDFVINDYAGSGGGGSTAWESFETGTKTSYTTADVTLSSGVWNFNSALLGTSTSDRKVATKSARVQSTGKLTMKFDRTAGAGTVTIQHAKYGTDANSSWQLWYSTNSGTSWTQTGATITTTSTTLSTATFTVNIAGTIRFEIRKTTGTTSVRLNFDEINISDYSTTPTVTEVEPNNTTASANVITAVPTTQTGLVSTTSDIDFFSLGATSTQTIALGLTVPAGVNYDLLLLNSAGTTVASSANAAGVSESISYNSTTNETYYIEVLSTSGSSTTTAYTLTANLSTYGGWGGGGDTTTSTSVHTILGNPSNAANDINLPTNYLMEKPQYVLSYHRDKGTANWVAWHLNASWIGSTARQDDFRADATLPVGWYQVGSTSYSGSGYDRGHMCPSADRTKTVADNSSTFLMTNMIPQAPNNNQGPWASMENYLRTLVTAGKELYIYSGGYGSQGTINSGHVNVPTRTWKIVVVIDEGTNDLGRVTTTTRVIAVDMPNADALISRTADWKTFRVSVDAVEAATGYDFLGKVSPAIQSSIESVVDNQ